VPAKLSRDQKRNQKLAERASRRRPEQASELKKYRSAQYLEAMMRAEMGILMADAILHRRLLDREVEAAVRKLVSELRASAELPRAPMQLASAGPEETIVWSIERTWEELFATRAPHSNADLAGILRVVLASIDSWSRSGGGPRAYLNYIEGFLGQMGVRVQPR
jgi:hypothetical protein